MIARWFAKRFLHPDIVAEYSYIFLWDEDLGVEDFHPEQYVGCTLLQKAQKNNVCVFKWKVAKQLESQASTSLSYIKFY